MPSILMYIHEMARSHRSCYKDRCCSVPLLIFFLLQCLLIGLAFLAVIYELTAVQHKQFNEAVYNQIDIRMRLTNQSLQTPIRIREVAFTNVAYKVKKQRNQYLLTENKTSVSDMENYFDDFYVLIDKDPLAMIVLQLKRSSFLINPDGVAVIGVAGISRDERRTMFAVNWNQSFEVAPQNGYPTQYRVKFKPRDPYDVTYRDWASRLLAANKPMWFSPTVVINPFTGVTTFKCSLVYPLDDPIVGENSNTISLAVNMSALGEIVQDMLLTSVTEGCLVLTSSDYMLKSTTSKYIGLHLEELPDRKMYATFIEARVKCKAAGDGVCDMYTYDTKMFGNGEVYIASFLHMDTPMEFGMELLQLTPRSYFFEEGERSIVVGLVIGCCAAVLVLLSSIWIWFAIRQPLLTLQRDMQLAAEMRNDEVNNELQFTVLREIMTLRESFRKMNGNLLAARPFMPQVLLCSKDNEDDDEGGIYDDVSETREFAVSLDIAQAERSCSTNVNALISASFRSNKSSSIRGLDRSKVERPCSTNVNTLISASFRSHKSSSIRGTLTSFSISSTGTSLTQRNVAVLSVNVCGWHTIFRKRDTDGYTDQLHTVLCGMMERLSGLANGIIDIFHGDHFLVTFNAAKAVASPAKRAANMALNIQKEVGAAYEEEQSHQGIYDGLRGVPSLGAFQRPNERVQGFSMGLSAGRAFVGNLGTARMKKFCTIGQVFTTATSLERLAKRLGRLCVLDSRTLQDVELDVYFLLLGEAEIVAPAVSSTGVVPCGVSHGFSSTKSISSVSLEKVYAIMEWIVSNRDDEWLYEVHSRQERDPYQKLNAVLSMALAEIDNYRDAVLPQLMQLSVSLNKSDMPVLAEEENGITKNSEGGNETNNLINTMLRTVRSDVSTLESILTPSLCALASQLGMGLPSDSASVVSLREYCYQYCLGDRELKGHMSVYSEVSNRDSIVTGEVARVAWLLFLEIERMNVFFREMSYYTKMSPDATKAALSTFVSIVLQTPYLTYHMRGSSNSMHAPVTSLYFEKF